MEYLLEMRLGDQDLLKRSKVYFQGGGFLKRGFSLLCKKNYVKIILKNTNQGSFVFRE